MVSRNYAKEIGLDSREGIVPLPYVIAILLALAVAAWYGFSSVKPKHPAHQTGAAAASVSGKV